jgi:hypothetical protein
MRKPMKNPRPGDQFVIPETRNDAPVHIEVVGRDPNTHDIHYLVDHVQFTIHWEPYKAFKLRISNASVVRVATGGADA